MIRALPRRMWKCRVRLKRAMLQWQIHILEFSMLSVWVCNTIGTFSVEKRCGMA